MAVSVSITAHICIIMVACSINLCFMHICSLWHLHVLILFLQLYQCRFNNLVGSLVFLRRYHLKILVGFSYFS